MDTRQTLQDRLRALTAAGMASMLPTEKVRKKRVARTIPDIQEVVQSEARRRQILRLAEEHYGYGKAMRELKAHKDQAASGIKTVLGSAGLEGEVSFMAGDIRVRYYGVSRSSISRDKLLAHGVSPAVIDGCTDRSVAWNLRISSVSAQDEDEED